MGKVGNSYMTRALRANDRRYKVILGKLGYRGGEAEGGTTPALVAAREEYREVIGKRPFHGWDLRMLNAKIVEARAAAGK